jgi:phosphoribosylformimino-5-aminoimidazole carboxamide ribotide isomerase
VAAVTFEVVPAIDLRGGRCVRLRQGRAGTEEVFADDPVAVARAFADAGAARLHVVDLDGAFAGSLRNERVLRQIAGAVTIPVQVGGGVRDLATLERLLGFGARWVILGTAAVRDPDLVEEACRRFPGHVAAGVDARGGKAAVSGWTELSGADAVDVARRIAGAGVSHLVYTDIDRDGMLGGPNLGATREVARAAGIPVFASGGVSSLDDLARLSGLREDGVAGAIVGRALYTGGLDLRAALELLGGIRPC